jgi:large subunit ribosomal protein L17
MKHLQKGRKFSRTSKQRRALLKIMVGDLLMKEKISTTEAKAKEIKMLAEKIVNRIKSAFSSEKKNVDALRKLAAVFPRKVGTDRLEKIASFFATRNSGYFQVVKTGQRRSDGAEMAVIKFKE